MGVEIEEQFNFFSRLQEGAEDSRIVVFGCGGHARSIINVIRENNKETEILLVDDDAREKEYILGCKGSAYI